MCVYFDFGFISVPSYGCMITSGVILANLLAIFILYKNGMNIDDFILIEAYCFLGAFIGAKVLYFLVSFEYIDWKRMLDPAYFNEMMQGGFVFYGGLIGGLTFAYLSGKIHKIDSEMFVRKFVFLIPFIHAFGRVGCFLAGCCYGIPYEGFGSVVFPEHSYAISGIELFPVQLVEAVFLLGIAFLILYLQTKKKVQYTVEVYLIAYAVLRFVLEYVRYDVDRGYFLSFSTSQWISVIMITIAVMLIYRGKEIRKRWMSV